MTDKFDDFENKLFGWISRHKLGILVVMFPIILWLCMSISVASMSGIVGMSTLEKNITEQHNDGVEAWNDEIFNMWENVIIPIIIQMFNTLMALMLSMVVIYVSVITYFTFRSASRKGRL